MLNETKMFFEKLYDVFQGYNHFEYDDVISFEFVNADYERQIVTYNKSTKSITTFIDK